MPTNVFDAADAAHAALKAGTLTQATPLSRHALERAVRYERFGGWSAPDEQSSLEVEAEVERRFAVLAKG